MIYRASYIIKMNSEILANGEVLVRDGRIAAVDLSLSELYPNEPVRYLKNCVLLPGFVNSHSHIDTTLRRNVGDGLNLWDWLDRISFGLGRATPPYDAFIASARLGAVECAKSGITCIGDCTFSGASAEALDAIGLRGIVYKEIFGQSMGDQYPEKFEHALNQVCKMQSRCSKRVKIGISPHSIYTSNREVLKLAADTYAGLDIPVALHLAETEAETQYTMSGTGPIADMRRRLGREPMVSGLTPARYLDEIGFQGEGVCLAHCVHVCDEEVDIIAASGVGVAHCARSNAYLGAGIAPITRFIESGAAVGLGTDGAGSCGNYDFFDEMRMVLALQRIRAKDAEVLTAKDVLRLATIGGARALGLDSQIGTIEPGKRADMIAVDLTGMIKGEDLELAILMRSAPNVVLTMVDGVEIVRDGACDKIDVAECEAKVDEVMGDLRLG